MQVNCKIDSDVDPKFFLKFTDIRVKFPETYDVQSLISMPLTPHQCRMRDITYAGNIEVDVQYVRGNSVVAKRGIHVARMPIMLRSNKCVLAGKSPVEMAELGECPLDPGKTQIKT